MLKIVKFLPLLPLLLTGCVSSTITNLTPSRLPHHATGLYPVEVAWDTREQAVRQHSLTPVVIIDTETYPMRPTRGITNRWEAVVPVPAGQKSLYYRFKFDYQKNDFGGPRRNSQLTRTYKLDILDK